MNKSLLVAVSCTAFAALTAAPAVAGVTPAPAALQAAVQADAISDAELRSFADAIAAVQPIAESLNGAAPSAEQQAQMAAAISSSGLALDRFNAISGAVSQDAHLRARMAVADARRAG